MESTFDNNPAPPRQFTTTAGDSEVVTRRELQEAMQNTAALMELWRMGHLREHELTEIARIKAEVSMDLRLNAMNELRSQIDKERGRYIDRDMLDARLLVVTGQNDTFQRALAETNKSLATLTTRVMVTGTVLVAIFTAVLGIAQLVY